MTSHDKEAAELLPCPFCGRNGHVVHSRDGDTARVTCTFWPVCMGSGSWKHSIADAAAAWNRRAALSSPAESGGIEYESVLAEAERRKSHYGQTIGYESDRDKEHCIGFWVYQVMSERRTIPPINTDR